METSFIQLDRNENQYGPAPACFEILRKATLRELSWYSRDYLLGIKSKLSQRLAKDLNLPEDRILLSYGSEDMLKQAVHCFLHTGEKMLIPDRSWWYYRSVASEVSGVTLSYRLIEGEISFHYDLNKIIQLYKRENPKIVLIASPNNPTGNSMNDEELEKLIHECQQSLIILDEAYRGFAENDDNHRSSFVTQYPNLLILRSFSKFYGLAGVRIGYACAGSNLQHLVKFSSRYLGYNRLSEELALAALDSPEYYEPMRKKMLQDKKMYYRELSKLLGWKVFHSDANFILAKIPEQIRTKLNQFLPKCGFLIKFFDEQQFQQYVRITIGTENENHRLIELLKQFVASETTVKRPIDIHP